MSFTVIVNLGGADALALFLGMSDVMYGVKTSGFSPGYLHMGGFVPPKWGGPSAGGQSINGGPHEGDRLYGGDLTLIDYIIILKVLLMLSCNYTMQFIGYDSIKTR